MMSVRTVVGALVGHDLGGVVTWSPRGPAAGVGLPSGVLTPDPQATMKTSSAAGVAVATNEVARTTNLLARNERGWPKI